jgi:hypothetical protein
MPKPGSMPAHMLVPTYKGPVQDDKRRFPVAVNFGSSEAY